MRNTIINKNTEYTIRELIFMGVSFDKLKNDYNIPEDDMKLIYWRYSKGISLGYKWESYYETEEQMLNEPMYNYNTLSDDEMRIYESN